jgi:nucleoside-diphosphate-sugar epimerase
MKVLITGGAGFIGYHLAQEWSKSGAKVYLLDNFSRGVEDEELAQLLSRDNVTLINANILSDNIPHNDYDFIYHLAAIIGVANVLNQPFDVLKYNTELTIKTIELAQKQKSLKRILFASTSEVYAGTLKYFAMEIPTPESTR